MMYTTRLFAVLALLLVASPLAAEPLAKPARPNVVVILTDDQRWDALGCAETPLLGMKTPHLDRLAREGAIFRNMFVTSSLCSPSRASMLSGVYAHRHRVIDNFTDYPSDLPSYPRQLQKAGYETAYIGKFHMGEGSDEKRPGFDYWVTHTGQGQYWDTTFNVDGDRRKIPGYYTHVVTKLAIDWLNRTHDRPFMLVLGHKATHGPFVPEDKYKSLYDNVPVRYPESAFDLAGKPKWIEQRLDTWHGIYGPLYEFRKEFPDRRPEGVDRFAAFVRSYAATVASVDDSVGAIYEALKAKGQLDNTVLIFLSDNGFLLGEHGMIDKRTMHEESIRVPMIVRYPARVPAGKAVDEMVLNLDLGPTIIDYANAEPLPKADGKSWAGLVEGKSKAWRDSWLYEYNYEKQFPYTPNVRGVRTRDWKYVHYPHGDGKPDRHKAELYHLSVDPQERRNLIDDPAAAAEKGRLVAELERLQRESDGLPDRMPLDEGVQIRLPEKSIR